MRIRLNYIVNGSPVVEQAELNNFPPISWQWPLHLIVCPSTTLWLPPYVRCRRLPLLASNQCCSPVWRHEFTWLLAYLWLSAADVVCYYQSANILQFLLCLSICLCVCVCVNALNYIVSAPYTAGPSNCPDVAFWLLNWLTGIRCHVAVWPIVYSDFSPPVCA
jgi:hypothetical protein